MIALSFYHHRQSVGLVSSQVFKVTVSVKSDRLAVKAWAVPLWCLPCLLAFALLFFSFPIDREILAPPEPRRTLFTLVLLCDADYYARCFHRAHEAAADGAKFNPRVVSRGCEFRCECPRAFWALRRFYILR